MKAIGNAHSKNPQAVGSLLSVIVDNNNCKWGRCDHTPLFDKISGNITLEYGLEEISKRGEFTKKEANRFLNYL